MAKPGFARRSPNAGRLGEAEGGRCRVRLTLRGFPSRSIATASPSMPGGNRLAERRQRSTGKDPRCAFCPSPSGRWSRPAPACDRGAGRRVNRCAAGIRSSRADRIRGARTPPDRPRGARQRSEQSAREHRDMLNPPTIPRFPCGPRGREDRRIRADPSPHAKGAPSAQSRPRRPQVPCARRPPGWQ
jgi:hypothetical protein